MNVLDGTLIGQCQQRHTPVEWLKFLKQIDRETPKNKALHLIADNYATAQASGRLRMADQAPAHHAALHTNISLVAQHERAFLS